MMFRFLTLLLLVTLTAGCMEVLPGAGQTGIAHSLAEAPPGAAPGTCWGKIVTPAVLETVTEQVVARPAVTLVDGIILKPATYKTVTRQEIVQERRTTWFEAPCAARHTPEFISTVQRALRARGVYRGAITGQMDAHTRTAIRKYQAPKGVDSEILSLESARALGLIAVERTDVNANDS